MSKEILNEHLFILYAVLSQYFYWHIKMSFKVLITVLYTKKTCQHLGKLFCIFYPWKELIYPKYPWKTPWKA